MQSEEPDDLHSMIEGDGHDCIRVGIGGHGSEASGIGEAERRGRDEGLSYVEQCWTECLWGLLYQEDGHCLYLE